MVADAIMAADATGRACKSDYFGNAVWLSSSDKTPLTRRAVTPTSGKARGWFSHRSSGGRRRRCHVQDGLLRPVSGRLFG